jgi:hypothetical protein
LKPKLSVILPVHNAQARLVQRVAELLDVLPDLTPQFELMIVDDGSTDHTDEIAYELSCAFPQVKCVRHTHREGMAGAVRTGMERTVGEVVFIHDDQTSPSASDLGRLWELRHDEGLVMAQPQRKTATLDPGLIRRLMAWGAELKDSRGSQPTAGGVQMLRRKAVHQLSARSAEASPITLEQITRADHVAVGSGPQEQPKFLTRVATFSLGE